MTNRDEFPRLSELQDISIRLNSLAAYFQKDDSKFSHPWKKPLFARIEDDLRTLDMIAWKTLKSEAAKRLIRTKERGWQPLFDTLNEAKGYNHLLAIGCTNIQFIPRSTNRTPDLQADFASVRTFCEVKTVNLSQAEIERFRTGGVGTTLLEVDDGLLKKIKSDLENAADQMRNFCADDGARRIVYLVVNFDNNADMALEYQQQVRDFVATNTPPDVEVTMFFKDAFER